MAESFGARLRLRREQQHVEIGAIAEQTKIKLSLLQALERDDVSQWPAGIFRRAYIRAYAQAIALDPDVVVREFLQAHPDPVEEAEAALETAAAEAAAAKSRTGLRGFMGSAFGSLSRGRRPAVVADRAVARRRPEPPPSEREAVAVAEPPAPPPVEPTPPPVEPTPRAVDTPAPPQPKAVPPRGPDWMAVAKVCTELGRVQTSSELEPLLGEAARIVGARGVIVWLWDAEGSLLRPALAHGYAEKVLAHVRAVPRDADNVTAVAFRTSHSCAIEGRSETAGALAVPLLTPTGCAGVLALELPNSLVGSTPARAAATIFAASLALLVGAPGPPAESAEAAI